MFPVLTFTYIHLLSGKNLLCLSNEGYPQLNGETMHTEIDILHTSGHPYTISHKDSKVHSPSAMCSTSEINDNHLD